MVDGDDKRNLAPQLVFAMVFDGAPRDCVEQLVEKLGPSSTQSMRIARVQRHRRFPSASITCSGLIARRRSGTKEPKTSTSRPFKAMPEIRDTLRKRLDVTMEHGGTAESTFSIAAEARGEYLDMPGTIERIKVPPTERISKQAIERRTRLWKIVWLPRRGSFLSRPSPVVAAWAICEVGLLQAVVPGVRLFFPWVCPRWSSSARDGRSAETGKERTQVEPKASAQPSQRGRGRRHRGAERAHPLRHRRRAFPAVVLGVVFWVIGQRVRMVDSLAGSLGGITSIHFGRWVLIDEGKPARRLVFMSDYDGSWESYLGEFVDRAAEGLSAVWSNTEDFPPTTLLVFARSHGRAEVQGVDPRESGQYAGLLQRLSPADAPEHRKQLAHRARRSERARPSPRAGLARIALRARHDIASNTKTSRASSFAGTKSSRSRASS